MNGPIITKRDWTFLAVANVVALSFALVAARYSLGWKAASASVVISALLLAAFCLRHPEPFFARLFLFGVGVGFTELLNDTFLINQDILVYNPGGPFLFKTPLYMPFTWALILVTNGTIAVWLYERQGPLVSMVTMAILSGLYIPGFEALAARADWWHYQHVRMVWGLAPAFVILGEALLAIPLPWMCQFLARRSVWVALTLGAVEGLVVWATTILALKMVG